MAKATSTIYTYEQAFDASKNYFGGDELAAKVFLDKYALKNNEGEILEDTPEKMHRRIAREFARIEKDKFKNPLNEQEIFDVLDHFKRIIPQGSPMFGIGNDYQTVSLSNCFLLNAPIDSYSSILQVDEQLVNVSKRRGGSGVDLSNLRPNGAVTHNAAKTSTGVVTWMERYSNSIREVGQSGRRGALMISLSVHHPDIEEFITIKNDPTKVTGANISVKLTREFIEAAKRGGDYELRFPVDCKKKGVKPKISKMVRAKDIWDKIIHSAWLRAEPGLFMWDNVTENTPADCYPEFASVGTNPCQPAWAQVLTKDGIRQFKDVKEGDEIWSETGWTKIVKKWSTGVNKVYKYHTTAGTFYGTENHRLVSDGVKIPASECEAVDTLSGPFSSSFVIDPQDIMDGLVIGDGMVHKASGNLVLFCIGENDQDYFESEVKDFILKERKGIGDYAYEVKTTISFNELPYTFNRCIPDRFKFGSLDRVTGFLRGLFSANGSIVGDRVTLKTSSRKIREDVQSMLSAIGIRSYYTTNKASMVKFSNGEFLCKESYDVNITGDREKFFKIVGFIQEYKMSKLEQLINQKNTSYKKKPKITYDIKEISQISEEETFDITVDNSTHTYWTQGVNVSNCGELNLSELDSCRLLCLNLLSYVNNQFLPDASFDFVRFSADAKIAQRLMDDLVDLESEKITAILAKIESDPEPYDVKAKEIELWKKIRENNDIGRRTGTGITALGDALAALGIKYGTQESIEMTEKIYRALKLACYESSVDMAEEIGPFKLYSAEAEKNNPYMQRIAQEAPELYARMEKFGRRNIALTTTAPTGSVSIETQTTSGIEPLFMMGYTRRKKVNPNDKNAKIDFTDDKGDSWQEFTVYHPQIKRWMDITGKTDVKESPWYGACAEDINWANRVLLQAAAQRHTCHSISSTVNLPEDVKEEEVARIYQMAFENGLKGITVYRKNCRSGVLVESKPKEVKVEAPRITKTTAPKRPQKLSGELHHFNVKGFRYFVAVGMLDNECYEIFAGGNHDSEGDIIIPKSVTKGKIVKKARGKYAFETDGGEYNIAGVQDSTIDALTRIISTALRHGADISFIVHQLEKTKGEMQSFAKMLSRTLKKHIKDGTKVSGEKCPTCGAELVRENGCCSCKSCGWSKCV